MSQWLLVSHDWLKIVLSVVFRDLWITSYDHMKYVTHICRTNTSFVCRLAGIPDVGRHLRVSCHSLTISVYHSYVGEYASQCTELIEYATSSPRREQLLPGFDRYNSPTYAIPCRSIATVIRNFVPQIAALHFVLIDCTATYGAWDTSTTIPYLMTSEYPLSLLELHVSFVYTSPPPALLLDAPRGTFSPPPISCRYASRVLLRWGEKAGCARRKRGLRCILDDSLPAPGECGVDGDVRCGGCASHRPLTCQGASGLHPPPAYHDMGPSRLWR
ncbi:hypothetical protein B0H16DRAFT_1895286 [Mycena metata]|uniref:Uncharacterized protein n=1 Tax=Mycena metata TaxID=1033252 RepID=A0AAD7HNL3_9AGAR|nr:hypothetical protein B0H16DRAFT_1895286 [Mycena metata]